jgi:NitT/TauT family transport system ATP-binding protein
VYDNGLVALDGVSLDVAPGEFVAVLGPSGSGKSTLLRLIAGLDRPQEGSVSLLSLPAGAGRGEGARSVEPLPLNYRSLTLTRSHGDRDHELAYVFQDAHLLPWRNVLDNVALPLELRGVSRVARRDAAAAALELVRVPPRLYPAQLSGGMRMRASLARALVTRPKLLLLDEPFAALDEITRQRLDEYLRELWAGGGFTVLFVTHSISEAVFLADRAVVLSRRPARVILDRRIGLPGRRTQDLRTTAEFAREQQALFEALKGEEP